MIIKNRIATAAIGITALSLVAVQQSAQANDFTDMFKNILKNQALGLTGDPITQRQRVLSDRIIDAINSNRLSISQTTAVKSQYDHILELERQYKTSGNALDQIETASLNSELTKLENTLNQMLGLGTVGTTTTVPGSQVDNTDERLRDCLQRITGALGNGRLTISEATSLKTDYDLTVNNRNRLRADGTLSPDELAQINDQIHQLKRRILQNTHDQQQWPGIDGQQAIQAQRITDGVAAGRISRSEFNTLKAESDRIAAEESRARANGLQLDETITLANDLSNFRTKVDTSLSSSVSVNTGGGPGSTPGGGWGNWQGWGGYGGASFDGRQAEVTRRIDQGLTAGKLTADEAEDLRYDMRRLDQLQHTYQASHNTLTPQEMEALNQGLNGITAELNEKLNDLPNFYPEIKKKQADLASRIDTALRSGQIKSTDAASLKAKLVWLSAVETTMRQSGGSMDSSEAQKLNQDLDRVADKLNKLTKVGGKTQEIATRKAALLKQIDDGTADGRLTSFESRVLRDQYQQFSWLEQRLSRDGRLDPTDQTELVNQLDRLTTQVTDQLNNRNRPGRGGPRQFGYGQR